MPTAKSTPTRDRILNEAFLELIERGHVRFTIQGVSSRAGVSLGNLTYYFPNRDSLFRAMIDQWFERWKIEFKKIIKKEIATENPDLGAFIDWVMENAQSKENVRTFTELWAVSNHSPQVAKMLEVLYEEAVRAVLIALDLPPTGRRSEGLRALLYVLAAVSEGSSAVLGNASKTHPQRKIIKQQVRAIFEPLLVKEVSRTRIVQK